MCVCLTVSEVYFDRTGPAADDMLATTTGLEVVSVVPGLASHYVERAIVRCSISPGNFGLEDMHVTPRSEKLFYQSDICVNACGTEATLQHFLYK